jgi:hypothetical protein
LGQLLVHAVEVAQHGDGDETAADPEETAHGAQQAAEQEVDYAGEKQGSRHRCTVMPLLAGCKVQWPHRRIKKETDMSGVIVFALEMGVVALIALAIYMVMKK